ncbi:MAG: HAMP domain-containing histidine kinase, partial [Pedobacter sp.]
VKTTYEYKIEQFRGEVKSKIAKITNDYTDIDSTVFVKKDTYYKQVAEDYLLNPERKERIKQAILQSSFKKELTQRLQMEFEKEIPNMELDFAIVLDKFVLYNETASDTIFAEKPEIANKLLGNLASLDDAFLVRNYVGTTSGIVHPNKGNVSYKLLTEDTLYVSIKNWEWIVMKRMALIFVFSVVSIVVLISLFVVALKSLIKQKKISDVKTDFINNITHELKTPLATLAVSTKLLNRPEVLGNQQHLEGLLQTVNRQNNRLQNLIDQVMTNALGHENIDLNKQKTLMPDFLHSIVNDFRVAHPNITIYTDFYQAQTKLHLDQFHLTTAITNVLENAVKYGCKKITVSSMLKDGIFSISIQDDGIGISKKHQSLLFDKFYRVTDGNVHNTKGLGLGLYYVEQIIKAHQGSVQIVSNLGSGATFNLNIPSS